MYLSISPPCSVLVSVCRLCLYVCPLPVCVSLLLPTPSRSRSTACGSLALKCLKEKSRPTFDTKLNRLLNYVCVCVCMSVCVYNTHVCVCVVVDLISIRAIYIGNIEACTLCLTQRELAWKTWQKSWQRFSAETNWSSHEKSIENIKIYINKQSLISWNPIKFLIHEMKTQLRLQSLAYRKTFNGSTWLTRFTFFAAFRICQYIKLTISTRIQLFRLIIIYKIPQISKQVQLVSANTIK